MASRIAENERIRAELNNTPGARSCGIKGCQVITQGGKRGLALHRQVVHASDQWLEDLQEDK